MATQLLELLQRECLSRLQYSLQMYASGRCLESLDAQSKAPLNFNTCRNGVSLPYIYSEDRSLYSARSSSENTRSRVNSPAKGDRNKRRSDQRVHNTR